MSVLIVSYDLDAETNSQAYESLLAVIKVEKNWARISESCYAIDTNRTPQQLYSELKMHLDVGDKLLIFTATQPYYGQHSKEVIEWLTKKF